MVDIYLKSDIIISDEPTETRGVLLFRANAGTELTYNPTQNCRAKYPYQVGLKTPSVGSSPPASLVRVFFISPQATNQVNKNGQDLNHPGHLHHSYHGKD